jgi:hypothetical protein
MAAALSVIVWRLVREERRRSDARVAALRAAASTPARRAVEAARASDLPLRIDDRPVVTSALFVEAERSSAWGGRLAIMAGLALLGSAAILFALTAGHRQTSSTARLSAAAQPAQAPLNAALELLSLRDERRDGTLTITGLVHNPRTSPALSRVTVTAYAFDGKGAFLASGHALLDVTSLSPGDDSPFVVTVPASDAVARYRIGFRGEDGQVIGHVDRRQQGPIADVGQHARDHS